MHKLFILQARDYCALAQALTADPTAMLSACQGSGKNWSHRVQRFMKQQCSILSYASTVLLKLSSLRQ